ncbi:MAG TPA: phosphodiester glycosidase family protein, partial [Mucilaginibacter sp.]|nr:phosphodiester glycosidase family protein [Mucilaginibacter sp.]
MKRPEIFLLISMLILSVGLFAFISNRQQDDHFVSYIVDPKKQDLKLYWQNDKNENFGSIGNLRTWLETRKRKLVFAMNGGMYKPDGSPQGLFIESGKTSFPLDTSAGSGNFYLKPNGVFYITTDKTAAISISEKFRVGGKIRYATQSGPM